MMDTNFVEEVEVLKEECEIETDQDQDQNEDEDEGESSEIEIIEDDLPFPIPVPMTEPKLFQKTMTRNSTRSVSPTFTVATVSASPSARPKAKATPQHTKEEEEKKVDDGPLIQFQSSVVGIQNDELAEKLWNDPFEPPISITLLIGEENKKTEIMKHRLILEQSPYFQYILNNHIKNSYPNEKSVCVDLTEFDGSVVQSLLKYLYTGKLSLSKSNVQKLVVTSEKFGLIDVKNKCVQVIQKSLDKTNCFDVRKFAKTQGIHSLLNSAHNFIIKHLSELTSSQSFLELDFIDIEELLDSVPKGKIPSGTEFQGILGWVQHDEVNRECHLAELMKNVCLDDLFDTAQHLLELPFGRNGILARNNECLFNYAAVLKKRAVKPSPPPSPQESGPRQQRQGKRRGETSTGSEKKGNTVQKKGRGDEDKDKNKAGMAEETTQKSEDKESESKQKDKKGDDEDGERSRSSSSSSRGRGRPTKSTLEVLLDPVFTSGSGSGTRSSSRRTRTASRKLE